jgi:hypothetical protein
VLCAYEAYQHALGLRQFAASDAWLALGSFDGKIRLLTPFTWQPVFTLSLCHIKDCDHSLVKDGLVTTVEVADDLQSGDFEGMSTSIKIPSGTSSFVNKMLKTLPKVSTELRLSNAAKSGLSVVPQVGTQSLCWSADGEFLAATEESMPRCVWIWQSSDMKLAALLVLLGTVSSVEWRPRVEQAQDAELSQPQHPWLAIATGTRSIYFWSPVQGMHKMDRMEFNVQSVRWTSADLLVCKGKDAAGICRITYS